MGLLLAVAPLALFAAGMLARRQLAQRAEARSPVPPALIQLARAAGDDARPTPDGAQGRRDGAPWTIRVHRSGAELVIDGAPVELIALPARGPRPPGAPDTPPDALPFGEALFDEQVIVSGPPLLLAAALDPGCRARLIRLIRAGGSVSNGLIRLPLPPPPGSAPGVSSWPAEAHAHIAQGAVLLRDLHRWRQDSPDLPDRLLAALTDAPRRRELALRCLSQRWPDRLAPRSLSDLRADPDPHVQAEALIHLQDWPALAALLSSPRPEIQRRVLAALPADHLYRLLSAAHAQSRAPGLYSRALDDRRLRAADHLLSLIDELARRAAPAAEPHLLPLLAVPNLDPTRRAAARALGALGGRDSAAALWELRADRALRADALAALDAIRARLGTADVGHVQIAEAGALALSDLAGALSDAPNRPFPDRPGEP